ncbi:LysR substrate-binding domain-containing protein [Gordonia otitidis]|uniref:LysR family transcriptional regulator n=1 Tax=Gordonia otitidis (strain DSM 44809 / CCUG 52243 / JCM 12355 / NBRC 100426 / IFM 10032) TaxID=1108044 RepID=H5TMW5_GORO1|nr:LysR substrate-binding domain-containing protein [Gordonia otitidis]UEA60077.1 LysR family transcriptional regulator [Gordonia otitidis]GAB34823.1 putative LysR family transcriptional regulator [Gordonia otitidis NBRC 100426]
MELRHLRYFRTVAEELHFGRAAERLHIAQPPLSQQIRQLEDELGFRLLVRTTRTVELTPAGKAYLERAVAILDAVDHAGAHAKRIAEGTQGRLAIGCVGSATYSLLPRLVRALREELPDVDVSVRGEMLAPAQIAALLAGDIDLALLRPPITAPEVTVTPVRRDRLLIALPDSHARAEQPAVALADLNDDDFISHAGQGRSVMHTQLAALCAAAGFVPQIRHEVQETSTLVTLVAAGLGVAVVPAPTAALGVAGVCYRPLTPEPEPVDLAAARLVRADAPLVDRALRVLHDVADDGSSLPT